MSRAPFFKYVCVATVTASLLAGTVFSQDEMGAKSSPGVREDVGDIHTAPDNADRPVFRADANLQNEFVTNAKMVGTNGSHDVLFLPSLEGGVNVPLGKQFKIDVLARAESVLYSRFDEHAFFGFSGMATIDYTYKDGWPRLYAGVEPYWYQSLDTGDRLATATGFLGGIDQSFAFNRGKSLVYVGYKFTAYCAAPTTDSRNQHTAVIGFAHQFQPSIVGQLFYAFQLSDYRNQTRLDSRHIIGAVLTKQWTEKFFTSLSTSFVDNNSSQALAEYQNISAGLTLTYQF